MNKGTIVFVSDLHLGSTDAPDYRPEFLDHWYQAAALIRELEPELVIFGGDLTRDGVIRPQDFSIALSHIQALGLDWLSVPGNHDVGNKFHSLDPQRIQAPAIELYRRRIGPDYWDRHAAGLRIIGINSFLPGSGLADEAVFWQWLERLEPSSKDETTLLVSHMPLWLTGPDEALYDFAQDHDSWYRSYDPVYRKRLLQACKRLRVDWVLSGHVHCYHRQTVDSMQLLSAPATAWGIPVPQWPHGDPSIGLLHAHPNTHGLTFDRHIITPSMNAPS